jgi:hypothetical protein
MARHGGTQVVGNIGMYFAAYRLSQMRWNVMPTARTARDVDLLAMTPLPPRGSTIRFSNTLEAT